jgi:branched-chain amino acid transport system substrate-binding protein
LGLVRRVLAGLALVLLAASCRAAPPSASAGNALRIGIDLPLSGPEVRAATPALNGVRFFVQTHPVLDGFNVQLVTADDAADPARGVSNVNTFVSDQSVLAMIGPFDGAVARKEIPVANAAGLAMVSPATSNPCLTRDTYLPALLNPARTVVTCKEAGLPSASDLRPAHVNNFFRLTSTDDLQGAAAGDFALDTLHVLRVAVISDHEVYGEGLADAFSARFTRRGGSVVGHLDARPAESASISSFLSRMKADRAEAVYYGGAGCAVRAQLAAVWTGDEAAPFLGGDGIAGDPQCDGAAVYATVPVPDASSLPSASATITAFRSAFGATAAYGPYTMLAYDATAIVYAALDRAIQAAGAGMPARGAVLAQVAQTSGLAGVTGQLGFDPAGDTTNRVLTVLEAPAGEARSPWKVAATIDYSARLPY